MPNRRAVVVGCNYRGEKDVQRKGCINDAVAMRDMLLELDKLSEHDEYRLSDIKLLTDDDDSPVKPTGENIWQALRTMFEESKPNDWLFFYFSGHGTIDNDGNEAIVGLDLVLITKLNFRYLVHSLKEGATFQMVTDSCSSGGLIDKETEQIGPSSRAETLEPDARVIPFASIVERFRASTGNRNPDVNTFMVPFGDCLSEDDLNGLDELKPDEGILLSACRSNEQAQEAPFGGKFHGVFTRAFIAAAKTDRAAWGCSHKMAVTVINEVLEKFTKALELPEQHACLYCSDLNRESCFMPLRKKPVILRGEAGNLYPYTWPQT